MSLYVKPLQASTTISLGKQWFNITVYVTFAVERHFAETEWFKRTWRLYSMPDCIYLRYAVTLGSQGALSEEQTLSFLFVFMSCFCIYAFINMQFITNRDPE